MRAGACPPHCGGLSGGPQPATLEHRTHVGHHDPLLLSHPSHHQHGRAQRLHSADRGGVLRLPPHHARPHSHADAGACSLVLARCHACDGMCAVGHGPLQLGWVGQSRALAAADGPCQVCSNCSSSSSKRGAANRLCEHAALRRTRTTGASSPSAPACGRATRSCPCGARCCPVLSQALLHYCGSCRHQRVWPDCSGGLHSKPALQPI